MGFHVISGYAKSLVVQQSERVLGSTISLFCGPPIPHGSLGIVLGYATAGLKHESQIGLCDRIATLGQGYENGGCPDKIAARECSGALTDSLSLGLHGQHQGESIQEDDHPTARGGEESRRPGDRV